MDNFLEMIGSAIIAAWDWICEIFVEIILPILISFANDIVYYFREMALQEGIHIPFLMDTDSQFAQQTLGDLVADAEKGKSVVRGVFNDQTGNVEKIDLIKSDQGIDQKIESLFKNGTPIVTLA